MRRTGSNIILSAAMVSLLWLASVSAATAQPKRAVRVCGAGALANIAQTYAESYAEKGPNCSITVIGATTGQGFKMLFNGEADLVVASREITADEAKQALQKGLVIVSKYMGQVELAIITNDKNSVKELTLEQLAKVFKGEYKNWRQVGGPNEPIKVTRRAVPESGVGVLFQEKVLKGAPYARDSVVMSNYNMTLRVCGKSFAIGYIPTSTTFFDKMGEGGVKMVSLKKDEHSVPYPMSGGVTKESLYPISTRFLYYWNRKADNPCVEEFVNFSEKQTQ